MAKKTYDLYVGFDCIGQESSFKAIKKEFDKEVKEMRELDEDERSDIEIMYNDDCIYAYDAENNETYDYRGMV